MTKRKTLYYLPTYGQLGNQLATLAHLLAFAMEYNYTIVYPQSDYFSSNLQIMQTKQHLLHFKKLFANSAFAYSIIKMLKILFLNHNSYLFGYLVINKKFVIEKEFPEQKQPSVIVVTDWLFRYYDGIKKHQDALRQYLSFTHLSVAKAEDKWKELQEQYPAHTFIGVHVRRGDYAEWLGGKYFYDDTTYYKWLEEISNQIEKPVFAVCSNEELCFENKKNLAIIYAKGSPSEDLFLLSQCQYIIGPPSTFSSWSAFLGNIYLLQPETKDEEINLNAFHKYYL